MFHGALTTSVVCVLLIPALVRAEEPQPPEPTPDTPKGAIKLLCHRLAAGDADKALELCPADTSDDDKALVKSAAECFAAWEKLRKDAMAKFEANEAIDDNFTLYAPKPPMDRYVDAAKETPDADDANKVELRVSTITPPIVIVKQGDTWRVTPVDLLKAYSWNRDDPADCFRTFTDMAKQLSQDLADGKFETARDLQRESSRRGSEYRRAINDKRRKGGL